MIVSVEKEHFHEDIVTSINLVVVPHLLDWLMRSGLVRERERITGMKEEW